MVMGWGWRGGVLTLCDVEEGQTQQHQQAVLAHLRCGPLATGSATHAHKHVIKLTSDKAKYSFKMIVHKMLLM